MCVEENNNYSLKINNNSKAKYLRNQFKSTFFFLLCFCMEGLFLTLEDKNLFMISVLSKPSLPPQKKKCSVRYI